MSNETIERVKAIITIVVTAAVNIANIFGYAFDAESIINWILTGLSFVTIVYAWWKNNNVTAEAATAQRYLDHLKAETRGLHAKGGE